MRRNAQPAVGPNVPADRSGGQIVLAHMHAIELCRQTEVGAIVHDEGDGLSEPGSQSSGMFHHHPRLASFIAILQQPASARKQLRNERKQVSSTGQKRRVDNGVKPGKRDQRSIASLGKTWQV